MVTARKTSASSASSDQLSKEATITTTEMSRSAASTNNQPTVTTTKASARSKAASSSSNQNRKRKATTSKKAPSKPSASTARTKKAKVVKVIPASKQSDFVDAPVLLEEDEEQQDAENRGAGEVKETHKRIAKRVDNAETVVKFVGKPVNHEEALRRWPHRYQKKQSDQGSSSSASAWIADADAPVYALHHYLQAEVDGNLYNLEDDAYVQAEEGTPDYICKIKEFFQGVDGVSYFTAQWYYRAEDTIIKNCKELIEDRRVFFSEVKNDNPLECLVKRLNIYCLSEDLSPAILKEKKEECDYFYDLMYLLPYSSFVSLPVESGSGSDSRVSCENGVPGQAQSAILSPRNDHPELTLLDLYSGCGGMSTGLSLGANSGGVKLTTKWAVDFTKYASDSLRLNHPETQARCESANDFLKLIKQWESLCVAFTPYKSDVEPHPFVSELNKVEEEDTDEVDDSNLVVDSEVYEVEDILDIRYVDMNSTQHSGLCFKIRWKGYNEDFDTWEPIENISKSPIKLKEFVTRGFENMILPLPGRVDVICGGPPCQGISGYNRFRNSEAPLEDEKNKQLIVYMDIIEYLKPRFVLMENVVDILKFSSGYLGRYAFGKLVGMHYQARLGMMAAGSYGLPQFRMRIFLWGALKHEKLPGYPLPTHKVINRGVAPKEFEANMVEYAEGANVQLKSALHLGDAISDLPRVDNYEEHNEMDYDDEPVTEFQRFIRRRRGEMPGSFPHQNVPEQHVLYDHRPLKLNGDDIQRVQQIPIMKGANFRHLRGVKVGPNNKVEWDERVKRIYLASGRPLVPTYAMKFVRGTSTKPFGRLWLDETVSTVMTRAEPHNHALLHPDQARVLSVRENARLQGFPDYYQLTGTVKEKYIQIGNAVAVPVACALGYSLARTLRGLGNGEPVFRLPEDYPLYTAEGEYRYTTEGMAATTAAAAATYAAAYAAYAAVAFA